MIGNAYLKLKRSKIKILFKVLYPYKVTRKVENFQKLSNKENNEVYFTL